MKTTNERYPNVFSTILSKNYNVIFSSKHKLPRLNINIRNEIVLILEDFGYLGDNYNQLL